jgi:hypothetical protein
VQRRVGMVCLEFYAKRASVVECGSEAHKQRREGSVEQPRLRGGWRLCQGAACVAPERHSVSVAGFLHVRFQQAAPSFTKFDKDAAKDSTVHSSTIGALQPPCRIEHGFLWWWLDG